MANPNYRPATPTEVSAVSEYYPGQDGEALFAHAPGLSWQEGKDSMAAWNPLSRCVGDVIVDSATNTYFWARS